MREGLDEDQDSNYETAIELYTQAIELCLKAVSFVFNVFYNCFHYSFYILWFALKLIFNF